MKTSLSIVIVNWNAGVQLTKCIDSIFKSTQDKFELDQVVIVDNASTDCSISLIPIHPKVTLIKNKENLGFGAACNIGVKQTNSELLLFLNPDTELPIQTLDAVTDFYISKSKIMKFGILGVKLTDENGQIQKSCSRFPTLCSEVFDRTGLSRIIINKSSHMKEFAHTQSRYVDQVMGAFFLTSMTIFENLNGFDEQFFVYYEEVDFSYRASLLGYKSYFLAETSAMHIGGGCSHQVKAKRLFYSLNSRLIYAKKHFTCLDYLFICIITLCIEPITRVIFSLLKRDFAGVKETISGYKMLYKNLL